MNESYIPLQIKSISSFNSIISDKNISVDDNNLIIDSNNKNNLDILKNAEIIINNFLSIPLDKRYIDQPSNNDIALAEKICYLGISIKPSHQYMNYYYF